MRTNCVNCGGALEAGWRFCEHCGVEVPLDEAAGADGQCTARTKAGARCRRKAMPGAATCSMHADTDAGADAAEVTAPLPAVGAVPAALQAGPPPGIPPAPPRADVAAFGAGHDRSSLRVAGLAAAAAVVFLALLLGVLNSVGTHRRLDDTRADLSTVERDLATTKNELASRTAERDDLRTKLTAAEGELGGVKQSLTDTRSKVDVQAGQIDSLKTCLNGVLNALDSATAEEAVRILDSIESACERSSELL